MRETINYFATKRKHNNISLPLIVYFIEIEHQGHCPWHWCRSWLGQSLFWKDSRYYHILMFRKQFILQSSRRILNNSRERLFCYIQWTRWCIILNIFVEWPQYFCWCSKHFLILYLLRFMQFEFSSLGDLDPWFVCFPMLGWRVH